MKSAHKLALALGIFLTLTGATYFIYTAIYQGAANSSNSPDKSEQQPVKPSNDGAVATSNEFERATGKTLSSTADVESAAVEPTLNRQVARSEVSASSPQLVHDHHQSTTSANRIEPTSDISSSSSSSSGPLAAPSAAIPSVDQQAHTQDLSSSSSSITPEASTTTTTTTAPNSAHSPLGALLSSSVSASSTTAGVPSLPPNPPATSAAVATTGGDAGDLSHAHAIVDHPTVAPTLNGMTTEMMYREATERPRSQLVDLSESELREWDDFKRRYARNYPAPGEEDYRRMNFIGNLRFIHAFNKQSQALFKLAVNHFADFSQQEINEQFVGPQKNSSQLEQESGGGPAPGLKLISDQTGVLEQVTSLQDGGESQSHKSVSYRNLTGQAMDQGRCRESSLFAAVAALETAINSARPSGEPIKLSEQQLMDCLTYQAPPPPAWPPVCSGHLSLTHLFDFLQRQGIRFSSAQEYDGFKRAQIAGQVPPNLCMLPPTAPETRYKMSSYGQVMRENLDEALANSGALVVAIDASKPTFHFYKSGLYHEQACSTESFNFHALLVAANYTADSADPQMAPQSASYTIRASFGPDWGEEGHMQLLRDGQRNKCLPQHTAVYPNIGIE